MNQNTAKKFGDNIKKICLKKEMSQSDICQALNLDRAYISNIKNRKQNLTINTMEKIASALGVKIDQLLK